MAKNGNRDDFTEKTKLQIAKRAGWLCSYPSCCHPTVGATSDDDEKCINIGTAAHICAAAPQGPRYDRDMTVEARRSVMNGIWMCRNHGTAVDSTDSKFTVEQLREWKKQAENEARYRVLSGSQPQGSTVATSDEQIIRLRTAANTDLEVFKRTAIWSSTSVELTLSVDGFEEPATTNALANAVISLDDLILIAPPGTGKTTTLFQIAEAILKIGNGTPLVVQLADWATGDLSLLDAILKRPAFHDVSEKEFRLVAAKPGIVLLLDGWNELDSTARERARRQVMTLKAELPEISLIISTRKQVIDIPFEGTRVDLLPLSEKQQIEIAVALRGDAGARIIDQAWRMAGIRELVTIPLSRRKTTPRRLLRRVASTALSIWTGSSLSLASTSKKISATAKTVTRSKPRSRRITKTIMPIRRHTRRHRPSSMHLNRTRLPPAIFPLGRGEVNHAVTT